MKLSEYLQKNLIFLDIPYYTKKKAIEYLACELCKTYAIACNKEVIDIFLKREKLKSTGLGKGLAVPHAVIDGLKGLCLVFGRSQEGIPWESADGLPVKFIFLLAAPKNRNQEYLSALGQISRVIVRKEVREILCKAKDPREIINAVKKSGIRGKKRDY